MKSTLKQFRDLSDPIGTFERLFRAALDTFLPDLADSPWYVRERDVVNLFVFGHLLPLFQAERLDIGQLAIEVPVQKRPESDKARLGRYADIVVWLHNKATIHRTCKPLVHIEWKNISCREENPSRLLGEHKKDISDLKRDQRWVHVSYAVLTDFRPPRVTSKRAARNANLGQQLARQVKLRCTRIANGIIKKDFFDPPLTCAMTCPECAIIDLQGDYTTLMLRRQVCPDCALPKSRRRTMSPANRRKLTTLMKARLAVRKKAGAKAL